MISQEIIASMIAAAIFAAGAFIWDFFRRRGKRTEAEKQALREQKQKALKAKYPTRKDLIIRRLRWITALIGAVLGGIWAAYILNEHYGYGYVTYSAEEIRRDELMHWAVAITAFAFCVFLGYRAPAFVRRIIRWFTAADHETPPAKGKDHAENTSRD